MAIYKPIEHGSGVIVEYHRIRALHSVQLTINEGANVEAYTEHYLSEEKRSEGKQPVGIPTREHITLSAKEASLIRTIIYTEMRAQIEYFMDGSDVIEEDNYRIRDYLKWVSTADLEAELQERLNES